jgi:rRNA-processing protein FCF1
VIDTSVLLAGISGFREPYVQGKNPSADLLYKWAEKNNFVWLLTEDILDEYKEVLKRRGGPVASCRVFVSRSISVPP